MSYIESVKQSSAQVFEFLDPRSMMLASFGIGVVAAAILLLAVLVGHISRGWVYAFPPVIAPLVVVFFEVWNHRAGKRARAKGQPALWSGGRAGGAQGSGA